MSKRIFFVTCLVFFALISSLIAFGSDKDFDLWIKGLKVRLEKQNISKATINRYLTSDIRPIPKIIRLDRNQPEYKLTFREYYRRAIAGHKRKAQKKLVFYTDKLSEIEQKYKVRKKYIISLWAIESKLGADKGKYPAIDALVTLAYDGRRGKFFEEELTILLKLIDKGKIKKTQDIKSSWAGALGNFQFMPSSYAKYGVDYNNNGYVDLWNELDDAFASAANYLHSNKWQYKTPCMEKVKIMKNFNFTRLIDSKKIYPISKWQKLGIEPIRTKKRKNLTAHLIALSGKDKQDNTYYLAYNNFDVLMTWNRSEHFAAAVCMFANSLH